MKRYNLAILGATGAVGQTMLKVLEERNLPIKELRLLASERSVGKTMRYQNQDLTIQLADEHAFEGIDIVLSAVENDIALALCPYAVEAGAIVIDNSSAFRLQKDIPLVVPEVNASDIPKTGGIIANPNCSTIIAMVAVHALHQYATIKRMIVSTYQAVSGAGTNGIAELADQAKAIVSGEPVQTKTFPYQIAFNIIPQIGGFDEEGYTSEEMKLWHEGRKILHAPDLQVSCTCVRIPVYTSHSEAITLEFEQEIDAVKAREILKQAAGVKLVDDPSTQKYPMPLDTSDQDLVYVGRIRNDLSNPKYGLSLWCCGDQLRKGAATNAIQIAEAWIAKQAS